MGLKVAAILQNLCGIPQGTAFSLCLPALNTSQLYRQGCEMFQKCAEDGVITNHLKNKHYKPVVYPSVSWSEENGAPFFAPKCIRCVNSLKPTA